MSGQELSASQRAILRPEEGEDWLLNDGIVNTESMRGPRREWVRSIGGFPLATVGKGEGEGRGKKEEEDGRGVYWHFGTNDKMDHADEIGVWIDEGTVSFAISCTPVWLEFLKGDIC